MSKGSRIVAWVVGSLVLIVVALAIAAPLFFDPNDYKQQITRLVKDKTGRDLAIHGAIKLSVFPWVGMEIKGLTLSNAPGFGPQPFATVESAEVKAKLLPLLHQQLELKTITLDGLTLNLAKDSAGATNWDDLSKPQDANRPAPGFNLAALAIGGLDVSDSRVNWENRASGATYTLARLNISSDALAPGKDFDIHLDFDLASNRPQLNGHLDLDGTANADPENRHYQFRKAVIKAALTGERFPDHQLDAQLAADIDADLVRQTLQVTNLKFDGLGPTVTGAMTGARIIDAPAFSGPLTVSGFNPRKLAAALGVRLPQTADANAFTSARFTTEFAATLQSLALSKLVLTLDQTSLNGALDVNNFASPAINFDLALDKINADAYLPPAAVSARQTGAAAVAASTGAGVSATPLQGLRGLDLRGRLRIGDLQVKGLHSSNLTLGVDLPEQTLSLKNSGLQVLGMKVDADIQGTKIIDAPHFSGPLKIARFNPREVLKQLDIKLPQTADAKVLTRASIAALVDATPTSIKLNQLALNLDDSVLKGDLDVTSIASRAMRFDLTLDKIDLDRYLPPAGKSAGDSAGTAAVGATGAGLNATPLKGLRGMDVQGTLRIGSLKVKNVRTSGTDLGIDLNKQTLSLKNTGLQVLGLSVDADLKGTGIIDNPHFTGPVKVGQFNPREVFRQLDIKPPQTADAKALNKASLSTQVDATPVRVNLSKLSLKLDDIVLSGELGIKNFSKPGYTFNLKADQIDLDRYLPPKSGDQTAEPATPVTAAAGAVGLPIDKLRALDMQGSLRIGRMKAQNVRSTDVVIGVDAHNGAVKVEPTSARLYQGTYSGSVNIDARNAAPQIRIVEELSGVQAGPLLKDYFNKDLISGKATVKVNLTGQGAAAAQIRQSLGGTASFKFTDGAVKGFNVGKVLREAQSRLGGNPAGKIDTGANQTDFSELSGSATLRNGIARNDDLTAQSPLLRLSGRGDIDIANSRLDYLLSVSVVNTLVGQGGKGLEQLKGLTIPVKISGPFSNLAYAPDVGAIIGDVAKARLLEKLDEKKADLVNQLGDRLGDKLPGGLADGLLGGLQGKTAGPDEESAPAQGNLLDLLRGKKSKKSRDAAPEETPSVPIDNSRNQPAAPVPDKPAAAQSARKKPAAAAPPSTEKPAPETPKLAPEAKPPAAVAEPPAESKVDKKHAAKPPAASVTDKPAPPAKPAPDAAEKSQAQPAPEPSKTSKAVEAPAPTSATTAEPPPARLPDKPAEPAADQPAKPEPPATAPDPAAPEAKSADTP